MADVEKAFTTFHNSQCAKFGIAHSAADFMSALKELDGTFVASRMIQMAGTMAYGWPQRFMS